nr:immunoglobulin light chain junction region [Macaca mulatta]MOX13080.1 immunoglobulin light chain junction region [Macaca mulatta]MOX13116.1 immunoglobulin light chain junction region [Macaca mulatta]MOX13581.1 immunoglobulin light chain junction region [Macaca mulatta]MOX13621.1 immunoglobulin light chain junction region [Macaca mulatta]
DYYCQSADSNSNYVLF